MSHYIIQLIVPRDNVLFQNRHAIITPRKWTVVKTTPSSSAHGIKNWWWHIVVICSEEVKEVSSRKAKQVAGKILHTRSVTATSSTELNLITTTMGLSMPRSKHAAPTCGYCGVQRHRDSFRSGKTSVSKTQSRVLKNKFFAGAIIDMVYLLWLF